MNDEVVEPVKGAVPFKVRDYDQPFDWWAVLGTDGCYGLFYKREHAIDWINRNGRIPDATLPEHALKKLP